MPDQPRIACPACSAQLPPSARRCSSCGASLPQPAESTPTEFMPPPPSAHPDDERFPPGTLIAERYRIAGQLGLGGMGEVYRATDLVLRQPVALKFLPEAVGANHPVLERFLNEVRIARQISHPNVCRVYDLGVYQGLHYISMEFVDGEDLASLLRRIGCLPSGKALEFARRICAGLAAAHEKGVLHRDLKPANIMIDGRGQVRIMDFGLAGWSGQIQGAEIRSGTPGYMAPEQLEGAEVTPRSDIYSLGVVLYEMFTGKRAFEAASMAELSRLQARSTPVGPSSVVKDLDPAIERVILRCLDPNPARRPASALAVAAALPGGDPLAAALAAGETPSPDMVAAAGQSEGVKAYIALIVFILALAGLAASALVSGRLNFISRAPFENSPEALAGRAREILQNLGYPDRPADTAHGFLYDFDYIYYLDHLNRSPDRWSALATGQPAALQFWYRTSPRLLTPSDFLSGLFPGIVSTSDPPLTTPGMIRLTLDPSGRLVYLSVVTPQYEDSPGHPAPFDWKLLFAAARLDLAGFTPTQPQWFPLAFADEQKAWTGSLPGGAPNSLRVEAAAFRGRPVYFCLAGPWTRHSGMQSIPITPRQNAANFIVIALLLVAVLLSCVVARRNARLGRGDRRGATRLAAFVFALMLLAWALGATHVPDLDELLLLLTATSWALFFGALAWVFYLALEPYARRLWPQVLISWSRLLAGAFRDPLVAGDALVGIAFGVALALLSFLRSFTAELLGGSLFTHDLYPLLGLRQLAAELLAGIPISIALAIPLCFFLVGLRAGLRRKWLAVPAFILVLGLPNVLSSDLPLLAAAGQVLGLAVVLIILLRFGLFALVVANVTEHALVALPLTLDFSAWYIGLSLFTLLAFAALATLAFRLALAGRPLFPSD
jgi:Protein kinase domain